MDQNGGAAKYFFVYSIRSTERLFSFTVGVENANIILLIYLLKYIVALRSANLVSWLAARLPNIIIAWPA